MVNNGGQVVGMNTAATDSYKMSGGQGFAIPIGQAMGVAGAIRGGAGSQTVHIGPTAFLGLGVVDNGGNGARVERVVGSGPAAGAGISAGDVITSVDGAPDQRGHRDDGCARPASPGRHHRGGLPL